MTIETLILATVILAALLLIRAHLPLVKQVWRHARWYEKAVLLACLLPIPGPVDEICGGLIVRRVIRRGGGR